MKAAVSISSGVWNCPWPWERYGGSAGKESIVLWTLLPARSVIRRFDSARLVRDGERRSVVLGASRMSRTALEDVDSVGRTERRVWVSSWTALLEGGCKAVERRSRKVKVGVEGEEVEEEKREMSMPYLTIGYLAYILGNYRIFVATIWLPPTVALPISSRQNFRSRIHDTNITPPMSRFFPCSAGPISSFPLSVAAASA
jgi:hypothetical protein